jgi:hypothetical protein
LANQEPDRLFRWQVPNFLKESRGNSSRKIATVLRFSGGICSKTAAASEEIELESDFKYERVVIFHVTVTGKETFPTMHSARDAANSGQQGAERVWLSQGQEG